MALIKCKECNKEISAFAETCPNCGNPYVQQEFLKMANVLEKEEGADAAIKFIMEKKEYSKNAASYYLQSQHIPLRNKQSKDIHLIKNIALFWCIITIIGMIIAIILIITGSHAAANYPRY
ncbi:MAG: hypothetical protein LBR17_01305 [Bacteroidales bacterium]|jgi:RNA polymerase subunit RPABC4/transcription elongation factor Spt4|nr:hypothetical protein [Bacteroidales bacterium]